MNTIYDGTFVLGQTSALNFEAGPGITVSQPSAGTVRIGNDETVLFENQSSVDADMVLSEPLSNFEYFEMYGHWDYNGNQTMRLYNKISTNPNRGFTNCFSLGGIAVANIDATVNDIFFCCTDYSANDLTIKVRRCFRYNINQNLASNNDCLYVDKIVGINRISGSNA